MYRLSFGRFEGRIRRIEPQVRVRANHAFDYGDGERVCEDIFEDVLFLADGLLLDVSGVVTEVPVG